MAIPYFEYMYTQLLADKIEIRIADIISSLIAINYKRSEIKKACQVNKDYWRDPKTLHVENEKNMRLTTVLFFICRKR